MRRIAIFSVLICVPAAAQSFEGSVSGGKASVSQTDIGSGYTLDAGFRVAMRATLNTREYLGYEFGYAYNRAQLGTSDSGKQGMAIHQGFLETLLYGTKQSARIRPFLAGGGHFANFVAPGQSAQSGQGENKFGINYGGGVKVKVRGPWQVRFDFRQYATGMPFGLGATGRLRVNEISAGVGYTM